VSVRLSVRPFVTLLYSVETSRLILKLVHHWVATSLQFSTPNLTAMFPPLCYVKLISLFVDWANKDACLLALTGRQVQVRSELHAGPNFATRPDV